jgi:hypothetical protein
VGDCWLLSAIAALAEYPGAIAKLFQNTPDLAQLPKDELNEYIVTLWDLETWSEVQVTVNESLCMQNGRLFGAKPSSDGELWVCILEKAVSAHCGGWDKINGGQCTHAWRLLTGFKDQYTIRRKDDGQWRIYSENDPNNGNELPPMKNSPHDCQGRIWGCDWPVAGDSGPVDAAELFERLCRWDEAGYLMGAGTRRGSDTEDHEGIVDGHAYTILECHAFKANDGTDIDLVKMRNPWGRGEYKSGQWIDDGDGWRDYPEIREACKPDDEDDGQFWLSKDELFEFFPTIYLCAHNVREWAAPFKDRDALHRRGRR